jgi:hypothetical protein
VGTESAGASTVGVAGVESLQVWLIFHPLHVTGI